MHVSFLVAQSCLTLCDPMDYSPPGSSVHGILQARVLEWVAMLSSRGSSQPRNQTQVSHSAGRFFTVWATRGAQEYWTAQPIAPPGELPDPGIEPGSPALQVDSLPAELPGKSKFQNLWTSRKETLKVGKVVGVVWSRHLPWPPEGPPISQLFKYKFNSRMAASVNISSLPTKFQDLWTISSHPLFFFLLLMNLLLVNKMIQRQFLQLPLKKNSSSCQKAKLACSSKQTWDKRVVPFLLLRLGTEVSRVTWVMFPPKAFHLFCRPSCLQMQI